MTALLDHLRTHKTPSRWLAALRALVRTDSLWLIVLAAITGILAGLAVSLITFTTLLAHNMLAPGYKRLSGLEHVAPWRALLVPATGGLLLGLWHYALQRHNRHRPVDPIEANALHGGRMSLRDSLIVTGQTILSNGCGISLGLEAGFSQIGSAFGSRIGRNLRMHRADVRLLVGCGAAGAIGSAFDAPLAGAFYAFELIIGSYAFPLLAPVACASLCALAVVHLTGETLPAITMTIPQDVPPLAYPLLAVLGGISALIGVTLMKSAAYAEQVFATCIRPVWLRPMVGGLLVGGLAILSPTVLSSGHIAMRAGLVNPPLFWAAIGLLLLKAAASTLSIGSGFRGGLFFASLYLGVLTGAAFASVVTPIMDISLTLCTVAGMCALATAIIGGPLTMILLTLETTHSANLTAAVALTALVASFTVKRIFGYSFATWRFHLRGENIRSGVDVGWMRTLTVGRMMRTQLDLLDASTTVANARTIFAGRMPRYIVLHDGYNHYAGLLESNLIQSIAIAPDQPLAAIVDNDGEVLSPDYSIGHAVAAFERTARPALAVTDKDGRILGILSERYVLRRYAEELERTRRELAGEKHGK
ncbi:chloride channel protein [Acetobacter syzygii]|uniref:chloride channel protein n=1 Tax=Acetobacter syzygii TaxID=146476 RepID=UPI0005E006AA|nr:chloride channel protein [Acetobacter syzygii]GAN71799.1 chloride channel protein [Acetobacter syzygii]GBR64759.1 chloride channel protein [Acetobacter syzygii NRIC 0483]GEL56665.1 chloride channel protein [Acetobacter syzygii]